MKPERIRLNKYLSQSGICSRRDADKLIEKGRIKVNDKVIKTLGEKINSNDRVELDGKPVSPEKKTYILLNKPKDFITSMKDERGRKTVMALLGKLDQRVFPVGRLDRNTTGLLLLTNDGELAQGLSHPKFEVHKLYHVILNKNVSASHLSQIKEGIKLEDGPIKADEIAHVENESRKHVGIAIHSGRNRIVKRVFEYLGYKVEKLDRVIYAGLTKKDLPRGKWRPLTKKEIQELKGLKSKV